MQEESSSYESDDREDISSEALDIKEENIADVARSLLEELPVRLLVFRWTDTNDIYSWTLIAGNTLSNYYGRSLDAMVGKRVDEVFEGVKGNARIFGEYCQVAKTGNPLDSETIYQNMPIKVKIMPLPSNCVMVVHEEAINLKSSEDQRKENSERIDFLLEKAVDVMIQADGLENAENDWANVALRNLFSGAGDSRERAESNVLEEEFEKKQKVISIADVETLIRNLSIESQDNKYVRQFLISYRYFLAPTALLNKLIVRFLSTKGADQSKLAAQEKVFQVFKIWLSEHFYDFGANPELLKTLQGFIQNSLLRSEQTAAMGETLNKLLLKGLQADTEAEDRSDLLNSPALPRAFRGKIQVLKIPPDELAQQLTLTAFARFRAVKPLEFYAQSWSKENGKVLSPNILEMIKQFNAVTNWICSEILMQKVLKTRVAVLKYFISVAWACYGYRDFETTFAIMLAMEQLSVSRLSDTWKNLDSSSKKEWLKLNEFTSYRNNYKTYRHKIKSILTNPLGGNAMPYFGLYLKDLSLLEESRNHTRVGAVNFQKMRRVAAIIEEIQRAQRSIFAFNKNIQLLNFINYELPQHDEETLWEHSKRCEFEATGEDPIDHCSNGTASLANLVGIRRTTSGSMGEVIIQSANPIFGMKIPRKSPSPLARQRSKENAATPNA